MTFDLQPVLKGELIVLRPLKEEDRESLFAVASDPLIWEQHPDKNRYQRPSFDRFFNIVIGSKSALLALDAKDGQVLGTSRYHDWEPAAKSVIIGSTFLSRACWGRGHNQEMKKLMLDHVFHFADTVFFHVACSNLRSCKAMEKIGGEAAGEIKRILPDGTPSPQIIYQIRKAKYNGA